MLFVGSRYTTEKNHEAEGVGYSNFHMCDHMSAQLLSTVEGCVLRGLMSPLSQKDLYLLSHLNLPHNDRTARNDPIIPY